MAKSPAAPPKRETAEILAAYIQKCKLFLADAGIHGLEETVLAAKCRTKKKRLCPVSNRTGIPAERRTDL